MERVSLLVLCAVAVLSLAFVGLWWLALEPVEAGEWQGKTTPRTLFGSEAAALLETIESGRYAALPGHRGKTVYLVGDLDNETFRNIFSAKFSVERQSSEAYFPLRLPESYFPDQEEGRFTGRCAGVLELANWGGTFVYNENANKIAICMHRLPIE